MKKYRFAVNVMIGIVLCYLIFNIIDCIRLKNSEIGTKPLIVLKKEEKDETMTYYGVGYTVEYGFICNQKSKDLRLCEGVTANLKLFNCISLWKK